jgi:hypothetical protein
VPDVVHPCNERRDGYMHSPEDRVHTVCPHAVTVHRAWARTEVVAHHHRARRAGAAAAAAAVPTRRSLPCHATAHGGQQVLDDPLVDGVEVLDVERGVREAVVEASGVDLHTYR